MDTPAPTPRKRSTAGFWIAIVLLLCGLLVSLAINFGMAVGLFNSRMKSFAHFSSGGGQDEYPSLSEVWSYGEGRTKAVRIAVEGVIDRYAEDGLFQTPVDMVSAVLLQIRAASNDDKVKAIILEVNSPGGGLTPSDEIWDALTRFKDADAERKIVVFMRDLAASGGYYVSMAGDWLIAEPTTIVGSIGVILSSLNIQGLSEKIGIKDVTIKSGRNKDLLNPFTNAPPEQLALLQEMIDASFQRFFDIVKDARGLDDETLKPLADGRIFDAAKALDLGLIDDIGYWDDAVNKTAELLGKKSVKVVRYEFRKSVLDLFAGVKSPDLLASLRRADTPRLMYLWKP